MMKYPHIKTLKQAKSIITEQDRMIGELMRDNNRLKDIEEKRQEWLRRAKIEAGYDNYTSFDVVWKEVLGKKTEKTTDDGFLKTRISTLDLSVRTLNCLIAADIREVSQLVSFTKNELLRFRNFGIKALVEVEVMLRKKGLSLKQSYN